jgi:hypothetical protein
MELISILIYHRYKVSERFEIAVQIPVPQRTLEDSLIAAY